MTCKNCNQHDNYGRKYCRECGTKLGFNCNKCGFPNDLSDKYCGQCGIFLREEKKVQSVTNTETQPEKQVKIIPRYRSYELSDMIEKSLKLKTIVEEPQNTLFEQDDIDKLFET